MSTAGYSGTPLSKKLGIKQDCRLALVCAPAGFADVLGELPPHERCDAVETELDVVVAFTTTTELLDRHFAALTPNLAQSGGFWVAWPKRSSGVETDVTEMLVRDRGLLVGLVDNKVCAIDQTWSGLRFVHRLRDRR